MDVPKVITEGPQSRETPVEAIKTDKPFSVRQGMLGLAIAAAVFNVLAPPVVRVVGENNREERGLILLLMPVVVGVLGGETGAMACWLVWGQGTFLRRLSIHWGVALGMGLCLFGGLLLASGNQADEWQRTAMFETAATVGCVLPAMSLSVQIPLWPFRTHLGWQVSTREDAALKSNQALSILDILVGTAIVAVSLGLIRFLPGNERNQLLNYIMVQVVVSGLGLTLISFVTLIPAIMLLLRTWHLGAGAGMYFGGVVLGVGGLIAVPSIIYGRSPAPAEAIFAMVWGSVVFAATVAAPLFVWRSCGCRLVWSRDRKGGY